MNHFIKKIKEFIIFLLRFLTSPIANMVYAGYINSRTKDRIVGKKELLEIGGQEVNIQIDNSIEINGMYFNVEEVSLFKTKNNICWLGKCKKIPKPQKMLKENKGETVIIFNGSSGHWERSYNRISIFLDRGFNVFVLNYPGYGESGGKPNPENFYKTAENIYHYVLKKYCNHNENKLLIYSISLGSGPVTFLSQKYPGKYLLDRPFGILSRTSRYFGNKYALPKFIQNTWIGNVLLIFIEKIIHNLYEFPNTKHISNCSYPLAIMYAKEDEMVPKSEVIDLYNSYMEDVELEFESPLFEMPGGHGWKQDEWWYIDHTKFEQALAFLSFELVDI